MGRKRLYYSRNRDRLTQYKGFDLNYVGVELGPSVKYRNGRIIHDPAESSNSKATQKT